MAPGETDDPIVKAENELLGAAASIEAAARRLAELKPRARPKQADETLTFEEQILEAAKSITVAAGALVKAASAAQRELVAAGKVSATNGVNEEDRQWSEGLISAASQVATATDSLCEAAHAAVQGDGGEDKLVASAKDVANSTAQLLLACRVKADPNSKTQQGLQLAGAAVKRAVEALANAAKKSAVFQEQEDEAKLNLSSIAAGFQDDELEIQELILRKERELEKARAKLFHIRKARYRDEEEDSDS